MLNLSTRANLVTLYSEPQRHYHTIEHIYNCLIEYKKYCNDIKTLESVKIIEAIWWHDAIYLPKSNTNEEDSAELYVMQAKEQGLDRNHLQEIEEIKEMILCSKHHIPKTENEKIFCDIDMSILGYNDAEYLKYTSGVEKEYSFVPQNIFCNGRLVFINKLIDSKRIFHTDYFHNKYEIKARSNLYSERAYLMKRISKTETMEAGLEALGRAFKASRKEE